MSEAPLMVGVSGLRGIVGESLTPEVAARFAGAFGAWLARKGRRFERHREWPKGPVVIVGSDGRAGYEPLRDAALRGLRDAGCFALDIGVAMTPTVGVEADHDDADGAMVITASHNPQQWNGLKCLVRAELGSEATSACAPGATIAQEIIEEFRSPSAASPTQGRIGTVERGDGIHLGAALGAVSDLLPGDQNWLTKLQFIGKHRFRVVLDSVNGAGRIAGREAMKALGCELRHLNDQESGVFPHPPEPTRENLTSLCDAVRTHKADIGFAQDPDADRLAIVDERGEYIGEEYTFVLAAEALLSADAAPSGSLRSPPPPPRAAGEEKVLVTNLSTSRMIEDVAAKHGARVIRTPVGEANVVEVMKREKASGRDVVLGGEGNGGVIWPRVTYVRDSLSAMALVLALMARTGKKVSELVEAMPRYAIEKRKVDLARKEDAAPAVAAIAAAYRSQKVDLQDGVRVDWAHGPRAGQAWLHVRASNTEPIMRLIAEAPTAAEARAILDEAAGVIAR